MKKLTRAQKLSVTKKMRANRLLRYERTYVHKGKEHINSYKNIQELLSQYIIDQINEGNTTEDFFSLLKEFGHVEKQASLESFDFEEYLREYRLAEDELECLYTDNSTDRVVEHELHKELETSLETK